MHLVGLLQPRITMHGTRNTKFSWTRYRVYKLEGSRSMLWFIPSVPNHNKAHLMNSIENSHFRAANINLFAGPQWPHRLRRRSAADRLLRSWVRIPPGGKWMSVFFECCALSGRGLCDELITRLEKSYRIWCGVGCDLEISWMRRPWPTGGGGKGFRARRNKMFTYLGKIPAPVEKKKEFQVLCKVRYFKVVHTITPYLRFNSISSSSLRSDPPMSLYNF